MTNTKRITVIATLLIIIGLIGTIFTYNSASSQIIKEANTIKDNINKLSIEIDNGSVEIYPTTDNEVSYEFSARHADEILTTEVIEDRLSIVVKEHGKKWFNFGFSFLNKKLKVYVPEKEFAEFMVKSNNGSITVEGIQSENFRALTDNGRIDLMNVTGITVEAEADNGKISLENIVATNINVSADNGKIVLDQIEGDVVGRAGNGSISLKTNSIDRNIDLKTSNGKIQVDTQQKPTNTILDVQVGNGTVRVFGEKSWDTVIGDGDNLVKLKTNNGKITIK